MNEAKEIKNEFEIMERMDEDQIVAELQGEALKEMVYKAKDGKVVLSWAGIKQLAYQQGGIEINMVEMKEDDQKFTIIVKATDSIKKSSMLGVSTQEKTAFGKPDQFALQKAMSKAQRNAIRGLLPEILVQKSIETFLLQQTGVKEAPKAENKPAGDPTRVCPDCGGELKESKYNSQELYCSNYTKGCKHKELK